ncbi:MAG TPA: hypothetical protein VMU83_22875 [Hanamia sp.]|nr:hypothetical protein [Hanamia sp.]
MLDKTYSANIQKAFKTIDWKLLLFLVLFLNVKLVVKLAAIVLIYLLQFNFRFGFRKRDSRLPLFYLIAIGIGVFNWIILAGFTNVNYTLAFITGICFWLLSILAMHQLKLSVEKNEPAIIHQTILVFFLINAIVSLSVYLIIVLKTGAINPYLYQGEYQKYFIGTGDYIKGISFDTSTTNAVLNAFGIIYFLSRKNGVMVILCMIILLLTGSNLTNLLLGAVLLLMFFFQSDRDQKSLVTICFMLLVIFLAKVSPQNNKYVANNLGKIFTTQNEKPVSYTSLLPIEQRPDSSLTVEERKEKLAILYVDSLYRLRIEKQKKIIPHTAMLLSIPVPDINTPPYQHQSVETPVEKKMRQFINRHSSELPISSDTDYNSKLPGKIIAWKQTLNYFKQKPLKIITGTGIGNFSSKLAFKTTGLNIAGGYPQKFTYKNDAFVTNHLDLYLHYFTKKDDVHSIINYPGAVYDQLISEYGLLGISAFFIFYLGFFAKSYKKLTYGIPLVFLLLGIFFADYWFEQLSVVVFFELLLFLNIKEEAKK